MKPRLSALMRFTILLIALLVLSFEGRAAPPQPFIRLTTESETIALGDTIVVEIVSTGLIEPIDLAPLEKVGHLGRQTIGTRMAVYGGRVAEFETRRIELVPARLGKLLIGPLAAGEVRSNVLGIEVLEDRESDWKPGPEDIRVEAALSSTTPAVGEQVTYDLVLKHRFPLSAESVVLPGFEDFEVVPAYQARRTIDEKEGWRLIAWRFFLFPKRSGRAGIEPARFSGTVTKGRFEHATYVLAPPAFDVAVAGAEAGSWWLPARDVSLSEAWSADPRTLKAGDEVERTLTAAAQGVAGEQIPDLAMPPSRGLRITPLGGKRSTVVTDGGVRGEARFRFRIQAVSSGSLLLDTVRLPWWDTGQRRAADAIVPARRIDIARPDRGELLSQALDEESLATRLTSRLPDGTDAGLVLLCILLAAALVATEWSGWRRSIRSWRESRRHRGALRRLALAGDLPALHAFLRRHERDFEDRAEAALLRQRIEEALNVPPPDRRQRAILDAAARSLRARQGVSPSDLPPL